MNNSNTMTIVTPEGVSFPLLLAGPFSRCAAWMIDLLCILVLQNLISIPLQLAGYISIDAAQTFAILAFFILNTFYGIVLEWMWDGMTIGKRALGLRVIDVQGLNLQMSQVVIRNIFRVIDCVPAFYMVGGISLLSSKKYQRIGDYAAQTLVIRSPEIIEPDVKSILSDKYNSFRDYPHLAARLRNAVNPEEASTILRALQRRETLEPNARQQVYAELANCFRDRVIFPQEAMEGLSDERYLRNIVDILFRG